MASTTSTRWLAGYSIVPGGRAGQPGRCSVRRRSQVAFAETWTSSSVHSTLLLRPTKDKSQKKTNRTLTLGCIWKLNLIQISSIINILLVLLILLFNCGLSCRYFKEKSQNFESRNRSDIFGNNSSWTAQQWPSSACRRCLFWGRCVSAIWVAIMRRERERETERESSAFKGRQKRAVTVRWQAGPLTIFFEANRRPATLTSSPSLAPLLDTCPFVWR